MGNYRGPLERMDGDLLAAWRDHYKPWSVEMSGPAFEGERVTRLQLVLDLVVDNMGPRQLYDYYRIRVRRTRFAETIGEALTRYAEIAGWIKELKPAVDAGTESTLNRSSSDECV